MSTFCPVSEIFYISNKLAGFKPPTFAENFN